MSRTIAGLVAVLLVVGGLAGVAFSPAAGAAAVNDSTVNCSYPITVTDASGTNVTVGAEPDRVVTLAPSASQVMWAIGAREKVVGMPVNAYTSYLNGSAEKENVVNEQSQPQVETVLSLEPDLVLAPNIISPDAVEQLRNAGVTVYRFEGASSIADVVAKTQLTGRLVGACDTAHEVSARTQSTAEAFRNATADAERPTVYYAMGGGYTAGPETFIGDVIDAAGGDNIATAANISTYDVISSEIVRNENPDWIVVPEGRSVPSGEDINETTAIQEDQIVRVDNNFISQPGPRVTQPLRVLAETFHPETTTDVSAETTTDASAGATTDASTGTTTDASTQTTTDAPAETRTDATTESDVTVETVTLDANSTTGPNATTTTTTTASGPGFGALVAIVALVGAALLGRQP